MELDGQRLSLGEVSAVARGEERVALAASARRRIENSRRVVERIIAENRTVYGINTGFGKLSDIRIDPSQIRALQLTLVAAILGLVSLSMKKRARCSVERECLALGYSGCRASRRDAGQLLNRGRHAGVLRRSSAPVGSGPLENSRRHHRRR